ncbi:MAG: hypothetical protein KJN98_00435, partial [Pontiella sp.]|nr:hypothetical protein [Pontiella sp.]
ITPHKNFMEVRDDILGDEKLLSQALVNLLLNAIDAIGDSGSITIGTVNCRHSFANGDTSGRPVSKQCVRLQITDTGKGIERENLAKIFDPFFTMKAEGTGMGLAVSHGIVQDHHAAIEVESRPGVGTTFFIFFPLLEEGDVT